MNHQKFVLLYALGVAIYLGGLIGLPILVGSWIWYWKEKKEETYRKLSEIRAPEWNPSGREPTDGPK